MATLVKSQNYMKKKETGEKTCTATIRRDFLAPTRIYHAVAEFLQQ